MIAAIRRGLKFLQTDRNAEGWWTDFQTLAGPSDEWVTAYVAWSIARIPGGETVAREALALLEPRRRSGGFGYAAHVPPDCDTTGWFCRLAEVLEQTKSRAYRSGLAFLHAAVRPDGGVPTYPSDKAIREFTQVPASVTFDGWTKSHVCVTAAIAGLRAMADEHTLRRFLADRRCKDGSWRGYWWTSSAYPSMLAAIALGGDAGARRWACAANENGAFALACRLLLGAPVRAQLLALQLEDGSWPASAELRVPAPFVLDPDTTRPRVSRDQNRIYTTATAIRALHEAPHAA